MSAPPTTTCECQGKGAISPSQTQSTFCRPCSCGRWIPAKMPERRISETRMPAVIGVPSPGVPCVGCKQTLTELETVRLEVRALQSRIAKLEQVDMLRRFELSAEEARKPTKT